MFSIGPITVRVSVIGVSTTPAIIDINTTSAKHLIEIWNSDPNIYDIEIASRIGNGFLGFSSTPTNQWQRLVSVPQLIYGIDSGYRVEVGLVRVSGTGGGSETVICSALRYKYPGWNWPPPPIEGWKFPTVNNSIIVTAK